MDGAVAGGAAVNGAAVRKATVGEAAAVAAIGALAAAAVGGQQREVELGARRKSPRRRSTHTGITNY